MIRPATPRDLPRILDIYNDVIATTTAAYVYEPQTIEMRQQWFDGLKAGGWPVIVAERDGDVAGFGSIGPFRPRPGYKYSGEHTLHVDREHRGAGIGRALLAALIGLAEERELRTLIGGIDSENAVSLRLHASMGFEECARIRQVAWKFDRWLDLVFVQRILPGPVAPVSR